MYKNFRRFKVKESTDAGDVFELEAAGGGKSLDLRSEGKCRIQGHSKAADFVDRGECAAIDHDR